jgi:hypothetical protein
MNGDHHDLEALQLEIGRRESAGDRQGLERTIAPSLAFRRADGTVIDREQFLAAVAQGPPRHTEVTSVAVHGNRAVVECIVAFKGKKYHNLRLFIREGTDWKLLGWANEEMPGSPA